MCTIHTLYTYTTIEVVDIDDDLDFTMYGYGKKVTLIIHTPIEFNISTRKMNLRSMRRQTLYGGAKGTLLLLNLLLNIWSIPNTVITWAVLLSHLEQLFDMTFGLYDLQTTFIYIFSSLSNYSHIRLETFKYWSSRQHRYILLAMNLSYGLKLHSSLRKKMDITILRLLSITAARSFTHYQPRLYPENNRSVTWYWRSSCLLKMFTRFL